MGPPSLASLQNMELAETHYRAQPNSNGQAVLAWVREAVFGDRPEPLSLLQLVQYTTVLQVSSPEVLGCSGHAFRSWAVAPGHPGPPVRSSVESHAHVSLP